MSAGLTKTDTMASVREVPWHGLGVVLDKRPKTIQAALKVSGLDWTVSGRPVYLEPKKSSVIPDWQAITRDTDDAVFGIVSGRYEPVQNIEAFQFLDNLLGEFVFETAGSLHGGKRVWCLVRTPDHITTIGGDEVADYVFISTGHDGRSAVQAAPTKVRVVCQNTLSWALSDAREAQRLYSVRHVGDPTGAIHDARAIMALDVEYGKLFAKFGDKLATKKLKPTTAEALLKDPRMYGYPDTAGKATKTRRDEIIERILGITYGKDDALSMTTGNAPGSAWAFVNAVAEQQDHYAPVRGASLPKNPTEADIQKAEVKRAEAVFARAVDDPQGMKQRALVLTADAVGVSMN